MAPAYAASERRFAVPDPVIRKKAVADALAHDDERAFVPVDGVGKKERQPQYQCPQTQRGDDRDVRRGDDVHPSGERDKQWAGGAAAGDRHGDATLWDEGVNAAGCSSDFWRL